MHPTLSEEDDQNSITDIAFELPARLFGRNEASGRRPHVLKCIDCHAGGEPARVVLSGVAKPPGTTSAFEKRAYLMKYHDALRQVLLLEPRGYPCQNVNFVYADKTSHRIQYVIGEQNRIYPLMSGHNTICVATALLETGIVSMKAPTTEFTLEAPAGPIAITAQCSPEGKAQQISFINAPSFVEKLGAQVQIPHQAQSVFPPGTTHITVDIAYGGMWYAVVNILENPSLKAVLHPLNPNQGSELCRMGEIIKVACREQFPVQHPTIDYPGVDILVFREPSTTNTGSARNAVVMSNTELDWENPGTWTGMLDRSPCGTGTCAVMAVLHARGEMGSGDTLVHESIIGSRFTGRILEETTVAGKSAILPQIEGSAYITQYSQVVIDPDDPFPTGYRVSDIW